jgi:glutamyl-tRNA synthetase
MPVRVRMAPSPTGFLHIGGVRTFLFNWLFARGRGGQCLLRIENTDTSREVAAATEQIQRSLRWLGIDWDGPVTFQLDAMDRCRELAQQLLAEDKAYDDDGAIRFRMPDEGATAWEDAVLGRIEVPNEQLEDVVLVRSDGRPTYNFANPVEDMDDAITHVIRGRDHVSNTPKQLQILAALGHQAPVYAHVPDVLGDDGKKLSKRHGATSVDEFRAAGYVAPALMNFLALLGWAPDGETTIMSPEELVERFSLDRVGASPATLDYQKLDWMNGVYLRSLPEAAYADALVAFLREQGYDWDEETIQASAPLVQEKIARLGEYPGFAGFFFERRDGAARGELDSRVLAEAADTLRQIEPFTAEAIEQALRSLCDRLGLSPRKGLQPIRIAVTGSKVSPGLFESIELLGRDESLARISSALAAAA